MKNRLKIKQRIVAIILTLVMLLGSYMQPKPAHALIPVSDSGNQIINAITSAATVIMKAYDSISSYAEQNLWIKEYILDPIAWVVAKDMVQNITDETVSWINNGANGKPAYIQNPTAFFNGIADQATSAFLADDGPLSSLCSPISLNVRLAIALNQSGSRGGGGNGSNGGTNSPYSCTLSTVINNVLGATINGFEAGDFSQGGWPAFAALAEPQNSFYGAYLEAQSNLDTNIANRKEQANNDLNRGQGFLPYTTCTDDSSLTSEDAAGDPTIQSHTDAEGNVTYQHCQTSTPGSTIKASLDKQLGASTDSLVAADEISEIIGALASELINNVLGAGGSGGLAGASQPSNGAPSYLGQIQNEMNNQTNTGVSSSLASQVNQFMPYAQQILSDYQTGLDTIDATNLVSNLNNGMQSCQSAGNTANADRLASLIDTASSTVAQLQSGYDATTGYLNTLNSFIDLTNSGGSASDLNSLTQQITSLQPPLTQLPDISSQVKNDGHTGVVDIAINSINGTTDAYGTPIPGILDQANTLIAECGGSTGGTGGTGLGTSFQ